MPTVTVYPNGDGTTTNWTNESSSGSNIYQSVDEGTDSPNDSDYAQTSVDGSSIFFLLGDMPADFSTATAVTIKLRVNNTSGKGSANEFSGVQLFQSDESTAITALSSFSGSTTVTTYSFTPSITGDTSKTAWDGARLCVSVGIGGSTGACRIESAQVEITYDSSGPTYSESTSLTATAGIGVSLSLTAGVASGLAAAISTSDSMRVVIPSASELAANAAIQATGGFLVSLSLGLAGDADFGVLAVNAKTVATQLSAIAGDAESMAVIAAIGESLSASADAQALIGTILANAAVTLPASGAVTVTPVSIMAAALSLPAVAANPTYLGQVYAIATTLASNALMQQNVGFLFSDSLALAAIASETELAAQAYYIATAFSAQAGVDFNLDNVVGIVQTLTATAKVPVTLQLAALGSVSLSTSAALSNLFGFSVSDSTGLEATATESNTLANVMATAQTMVASAATMPLLNVIGQAATTLQGAASVSENATVATGIAATLTANAHFSGILLSAVIRNTLSLAATVSESEALVNAAVQGVAVSASADLAIIDQATLVAAQSLLSSSEITASMTAEKNLLQSLVASASFRAVFDRVFRLGVQLATNAAETERLANAPAPSIGLPARAALAVTPALIAQAATALAAQATDVETLGMLQNVAAYLIAGTRLTATPHVIMPTATTFAAKAMLSPNALSSASVAANLALRAGIAVNAAQVAGLTAQLTGNAAQTGEIMGAYGMAVGLAVKAALEAIISGQTNIKAVRLAQELLGNPTIIDEQFKGGNQGTGE